MSRKVKIAALCFALLTAVILLGAQKNTRKLVPQSEQTKEIAGYRQWTKVNPRPIEMFKTVAELCAAPTLHNRADSAKPQTDNPHFRKFITVYVNAMGRAAMLEQKTPHFPVGSIIVKEKLSAETSKDPELLTVMIKREAGYNQANGDWEYLVTDGTGEKVTARGKLENCAVCHLGGWVSAAGAGQMKRAGKTRPFLLAVCQFTRGCRGS